jgi:hypothetical protein
LEHIEVKICAAYTRYVIVSTCFSTIASATLKTQVRLTQDEQVALIPMIKLRIDAVKKMLQQVSEEKA